ncbi:hypothetical protein ABIE09_004386 [Lysobacter enzymogenes]|uniref:hypothetical protein n=1 Tax=Lysobacter enzymogenes TaxID=69 RepID=UPI0033918EF7
MRGADAGIDTAVLELAPLWTQAQRAYQSACVGAQWLVLGICAAFLAPKLELGWLARVAAMAVAVSAFFHGRAAWLETRFALAVRACVWNRWRANALPELACLRRLGRGLAWAAVAGWTLAGVVSLLVFPIGLSYELPGLLRAYGLILAISVLRLPYTATASRRLLLELDECSHRVACSDVAAM